MVVGEENREHMKNGTKLNGGENSTSGANWQT